MDAVVKEQCDRLGTVSHIGRVLRRPRLEKRAILLKASIRTYLQSLRHGTRARRPAAQSHGAYLKHAVPARARNDRLALPVVLITLWGVGIAGGFWLATENDIRPTAAGAAPTNWPSDSQIRRSDAGWTILMFVHPRCPCSRASLAELSRIAEECSERVTVHLAFIHPDGTPADWAHTSLWEAAARMPGIQVTFDKSGHEASRFGAAHFRSNLSIRLRGSASFQWWNHRLARSLRRATTPATYWFR